jgi:hypothetical protein
MVLPRIAGVPTVYFVNQIQVFVDGFQLKK